MHQHVTNIAIFAYITKRVIPTNTKHHESKRKENI